MREEGKSTKSPTPRASQRPAQDPGRPAPPAPEAGATGPPRGPPAAAPAAPAASAAASASVRNNWQAQIVGWLARYKRYPRPAQEQRQQGATYLRFTIDREGRVLSHRIERS